MFAGCFKDKLGPKLLIFLYFNVDRHQLDIRLDFTWVLLYNIQMDLFLETNYHHIVYVCE